MAGTRPDPLWRRIGECAYVVAVAVSHFVADVVEDAVQEVAVRARAKRHRVFRVTRPR